MPHLISLHPYCIEYPLITIAGGISEGIFTADSRELNIHPIAPAQAD
jgi:hypothetical protein